MYTKREAAQKLGIDRKTLDKWLKASGIEPARDGRDRRLRVLSEEDVRTIRDRYADRHTFSASFTHRPQTVHTSSADLDELRAQVAALQQQLAALMATRHTPNLTAQPQRPAYAPPPRLTATTVRQASTKHPPLPPGIVGVEPFAHNHDMSRSTIKNAVLSGRLHAERGDYQDGGNVILNVLDAAGQAQAHRLWVHRFGDPCRFCGWSSSQINETTPTHAVVEVARPESVEE